MVLPVSTNNISEKHAASYCKTKCRKPTYKMVQYISLCLIHMHLNSQISTNWPTFPCRQTVKVQVLIGTAVLVHTMKAM